MPRDAEQQHKKELRNLLWQLARYRETVRVIQEILGMGRTLPVGDGRPGRHQQIRRRIVARLTVALDELEKLRSANEQLSYWNQELNNRLYELELSPRTFPRTKR